MRRSSGYESVAADSALSRDGFERIANHGVVETDLRAALAGVEAELEPFPAEAYLPEIQAYLRLVGYDWTAEAKADFIAQLCEEIAEMPGRAVLPCLKSARRRVARARELLSWIDDGVRQMTADLYRERSVYRQLLEYLQPHVPRRRVVLDEFGAEAEVVR